MIYKINTVILMLLCASFGALAQNDYSRISAKAQRFFDYQEWPSATAMYLLMLEEKPAEVETYAHCIVSYVMSGDTLPALEMTPKAMAYRIPIDSLLTEVRDISFSVGRGDLYENYLLGIKSHYTWLSRIADNYLMKYYAMRQNGPELIRYARIMLEGLPDDRNFLRMLAHGELLNGKTDKAIATWKHIIALYPDDYDTTLDLANCYDALGDRQLALEWLQRAQSMHRTPYVESRISALQ